ncbi:MAG: DUF6607 family protein [Stenotrophomonas maltophilia]
MTHSFALAGLLLALTASAHAVAADPARDHASILAMQGEYTVDFAFDETVLLAPGYERAPAVRTGGNEVVIVVEDTPTWVVLQHLLVDAKSGHVTKHWRQDWVYQAQNRFEFSADQTRVRQRWDGFLGQAPGVHLKSKPDGMAMIIPLFTHAQDIQDGKGVADTEIDSLFQQWVGEAPTESAR